MVDVKNSTKKSVNKGIKQKNSVTKSGKNVKNSGGNGIYYSFLTVILLLCLIQISVSAIINVSKIFAYKTKIVQITKTRDEASALNEQLKDNINNFSSVSGLEEIARNNLKMSSEDEVLVIINEKKQEEDESQNKNKKFGFIKSTSTDTKATN